MERESKVHTKNKQWVYLGCEYHRWQTLKLKSSVSTDIELLTLLLDCYIQLHIKDFEILPVASDLFIPLDGGHESKASSAGPVIASKTDQEADNVTELDDHRDEHNHTDVDQEIAGDEENDIEDACSDDVKDETDITTTGCEDIIIKQEPMSPSSYQEMEHYEDSFTGKGSFMDTQNVNHSSNSVTNTAKSSTSKPKTSKTTKPGERRLYYCNLCDHTTYSKGNLYRHKKGIHYKTKISCPICGKLFSQNYYLAQHRRSIHENNKLQCELCPEQFNAISTLRRHRMLKHSTEGRYTCEICDAKFYDKNMYEGHCNSHTNAKPYMCLQCKKMFKYKSSLHRHEINCLNPDAERFECDLCDKTMKTKGSLRAHMRIVHGEKDQNCICEKSFTTITALKRHQKVCPEANFGYETKGDDNQAIAIFL